MCIYKYYIYIDLLYLFVDIHLKKVVKDFWLFLRSLSFIGSSGSLAGRISAICRLNPSPWCRVTTKNRGG